jgi:DNA adenine methylase
MWKGLGKLRAESVMRVPHPIPYQGSKRNIARFILSFLPHQAGTLVEPFAGSAAVSLAAAGYGRASRFHLNDINEPLMALWREIIYSPTAIADGYEKLWCEQQGKEREFYDFVRGEFNGTKRPDYLLYLLARCVKASVRYNAEGAFNQSPDNRRKGRDPKNMRDDIFAASHLLRGRTTITSVDYRAALEQVSIDDVLYMDPPYQGVSNNKDPRYYNGMDFDGFVCSLQDLLNHGIPFILSYDGRTGQKTYGQPLPPTLELHHIEVRVGRSAQSTLLGGDDITYESVYLSNELIDRLGCSPDEIVGRFTSSRETQRLFDVEVIEYEGHNAT